MGRRWAITTLNFKEVIYESGNLHNQCSDNLEPNLKDKVLLGKWSAIAMLELQRIWFAGWALTGSVKG